MDSAASAVGKLFSSKPAVEKETTHNTSKSDNASKSDNTSKSDSTPVTSSTGADVDTTVDKEVAPAVEHEHIKKEHETREQTFVEKEKHKDHYHTTIQPLKDTEVAPEKHDHVEENEIRNFDHDNSDAKAKAEADRAGFQSTSEKQEFESTTKEPTLGEEHVHHHLHETIQPVIEKGKFDHGVKDVIVPSVTHKKVNVKERHQEESENHGVTTKSAMSVDDFKNKLDGSEKTSEVVGGEAV
ncbi:hypothetical protein LOCC1_G003771 [Lachnellula occidentalis]|uniref:Allergen n=1 Tax=Lachnellula occidentalis TaxID=215460 RepID=A0A8H8S407_9HELO|nr:hypothetical protein LOCC1_G003771 [Lachnellula occidentalis]